METIQLQGIGVMNAIKAEALEVGTRTIWNYGFISVVTAIEPKGKQSLLVTVRSEQDGQLYTRTMRRSRLVGVTRR